MLTHYNVVNNGKAIGDCMDLSTADRMMIQVPMFHCFGMVLALSLIHIWSAAISLYSPASALPLPFWISSAVGIRPVQQDLCGPRRCHSPGISRLPAFRQRPIFSHGCIIEA